MKRLLLIMLTMLTMAVTAKPHEKVAAAIWPDGTVMDAWFSDTTRVDVKTLGKQYVVTEYGVMPGSSEIQTTGLQAVIDRCASEGGGVVVIPQGTFVTGALFFHQGTHLHLQEGGILKGSDRIRDYPIMLTRIEGETCKYFAALINADGIDGFTITGKGTIDGNGLSYWQEFWTRRQWNPLCTNKDAQRPRLTYISNSKNVTVQDVHLINSPFWTNHIYKSHHVRYIGCYIFAPTENIWPEDPERGAPSSDAIDVDACTDVMVYGCYMHVNDDAVVMKGGKGTWADKDETNGPCERVLIQNCRYGRVHACLTLGSEAIHCRNIIMRDCHATKADRILWLKMRPDTPQHYEYILVENVSGQCGSLLYIHPWTQFFAPGNRQLPVSQCHDVTMNNISASSMTPLSVCTSDKYELHDFTIDGKPIDFSQFKAEEKVTPPESSK